MEKGRKEAMDVDNTSSEESIEITTVPHSQSRSPATNARNLKFTPHTVEAKPGATSIDMDKEKNPKSSDKSEDKENIKTAVLMESLSVPSTSTGSGSHLSTAGALSHYCHHSCLYGPTSDTSMSTISLPEETETSMSTISLPEETETHEETDDDDSPPKKKLKKEDR